MPRKASKTIRVVQDGIELTWDNRSGAELKPEEVARFYVDSVKALKKFKDDDPRIVPDVRWSAMERMREVLSWSAVIFFSSAFAYQCGHRGRQDSVWIVLAGGFLIIAGIGIPIMRKLLSVYRERKLINSDIAFNIDPTLQDLELQILLSQRVVDALNGVGPSSEDDRGYKTRAALAPLRQIAKLLQNVGIRVKLQALSFTDDARGG